MGSIGCIAGSGTSSAGVPHTGHTGQGGQGAMGGIMAAGCSGGGGTEGGGGGGGPSSFFPPPKMLPIAGRTALAIEGSASSKGAKKAKPTGFPRPS